MAISRSVRIKSLLAERAVVLADPDPSRVLPVERLLETPEHAYRLLGLEGAGALTGAWTPQTKVAYGTGRRPGGEGCLAQCDSIHRTRGSGPGGDTGSTNIRT